MIIRVVEWMNCQGKYTNPEQNCSFWVLGVHYIDIQRFIDGRPFAGLSFERSVERAAPNYWLIIGRSALEMIKLKIVPLPTAKQCNEVYRFPPHLYLLSIPAPWQPHCLFVHCLYVRVYLCCTALQLSCGSIAKWGSVLLVRSKPEAKIRISGRFWSDLKPRYWKQGYQGSVCLQ